MTAFIGNFISKSSAPLESHASGPGTGKNSPKSSGQPQSMGSSVSTTHTKFPTSKVTLLR